MTLSDDAQQLLDESRREERGGSDGPPCPACTHLESRVLQARHPRSRHREDFKRRRQCVSCGHRFTTYETLGN